MNKYLKLILIATLTFLLLITNLVASVSGKISGVIKAKDSDEPLVGANVIVNGTSMGAACDINGYYNIFLQYKNQFANMQGWELFFTMLTMLLPNFDKELSLCS
jgi:hypothetical protein